MEGVIYYNLGKKCLIRLAVSLFTLRKYYKGNAAIICDALSYRECVSVANEFHADVMVENFKSADIGKNSHFLNKCRLHEVTPYEKTLFIDSDTVIMRDFSNCFDLLNDNEFIVSQFSEWLSTERHYRKRIKGWAGILPEEIMDHAFDERKAVNIGFYGWKAGAEIFDIWYHNALKNRESFIPDEISCQILLPQVPHLVISKQYNLSCKFDELTAECYALHFHGRKHCRIDNGKYLYHSDVWYKEFDKIKAIPNIKDLIQYDRNLCKYLKVRP